MAAQLTGTLANFIVRIRRYIGEEDPDKSYWDDDLIKQVFNAHYRKRCAELVMAFEGYFTVVATRDTVTAQERYAWPSNFERLLKMEIVRSDGSTVPIQRQERHYHSKPTPGASGDTYFPSYRSIGSGFVLEPAPTEGTAGQLRMEYVSTPVELTLDNDSLHSDFPTMLDELLVLDTAVAMFDQEQSQEEGRVRSLIRQRAEWELTWERFIDNRMISSNKVTPFRTHYNDA
jgi:hypothetical protein